jgi:hypothetical protein
MKSYSETDVFTKDELSLLEAARALVERVFDRESVTVRCHELARAVGELLDLEVADGFYGFVDHSWLWTTPLPKGQGASYMRIGWPNILDVYSVGQLPMVRLVSCYHPQLPHLGLAYRMGPPRDDINQLHVAMFVDDMRGG